MSASIEKDKISTRTKDDSVIRGKLLSNCRITAQKSLYEILNPLFKQVDEELFSLYQDANNCTLQSLYYDSMHEIRRHKDEFISKYNEAFNARYRSGCTAISNETEEKLPSYKSSGTGLTLTGSDELEEKIAISSLTNKIQLQVAESLTELTYRFSYLLNSREPLTDLPPLSPHLFSEIFQATCTVFDIPLEAKLVLYKQFEIQMLNNLQGLYDEINELLIQQGVYPNYVPCTAPIKQEENSVDNEDKPDITSTEPSFDQLSQMLTASRQDTGQAGTNIGTAGTNTGTNVGTYLSTDIVSALNKLQTSGEQALPINESLLGILKNLPDTLPDGAISSEESNAIDLIEMIFDYIYDDKELSNRLKAIVARLQIPLLKIAILDKQFFSNKEHPARKLLNEFTQAGIVDSEQRIENKIESLVNRIVNEFSSDTTLFIDLLDEFNQFMDSEKEVYYAQQQQQLREAKLQEQRAQVGIIVDEEISNRMPEQPLPDLFQKYINEVWRELLINTYQEEGLESHDWRLQLDMTKELLWSVSPKTSKEERSHLAKIIPLLVKILNESLNDTSWDKLNIDALFTELGDCHISALRGGSANSDNINSEQSQEKANSPDNTLRDQMLNDLKIFSAEENITLDDGNILNQPEDDLDLNSENMQIDDEGDYYDERVANLQLGDWVEFTEDETSPPIRAHLVWRGEIENSMIFSNWRHEIIRRCSDSELAKKLRTWDARILNSAPLMERALASVMGILAAKTEDNVIQG